MGINGRGVSPPPGTKVTYCAGSGYWWFPVPGANPSPCNVTRAGGKSPSRGPPTPHPVSSADLRPSRPRRAQGDCDPEAPAAEGARCCRQETYVDLRGMRWAENWVLEPPGFLAYECVGACQQPPEPPTFRRPFPGPRQCVASETTSLPLIVGVKEGGRPRPQVVSLPNMRVEKCSCAWDGAPVPRRLGP